MLHRAVILSRVSTGRATLRMVQISVVDSSFLHTLTVLVALLSLVWFLAHAALTSVSRRNRHLQQTTQE